MYQNFLQNICTVIYSISRYQHKYLINKQKQDVYCLWGSKQYGLYLALHSKQF